MHSRGTEYTVLEKRIEIIQDLMYLIPQLQYFRNVIPHHM